uniref:Uncharacterized protein n=1 Tax=Onchocerca volvulus TaxID=6282 RepID=A0A2K6W9H5_ONCVO
MDDNLSEEPVQTKKFKRRFKFMSVKAVIGNESNTANLDENGITTPEMATITEANLLEIPPESDTVSKTYGQENSREASNVILPNKRAITNVPSNSSFSKINSESLFCEVPPRETLSKSFSNEISSKTSIGNISDSSSCAIESDESLTQSSAQILPAETTNTLLQKTEPKTADTAPINITEAQTSLTAQEEISDAFPSPIQDKTNEAIISKDNTQNLVARTTASAVATQPVITAGYVNEGQVLQEVQMQHSLPAPISESSKKQTSLSVPAQAASQTSKSDAAQTHTVVSESLGNLASVPVKNCIISTVSDASIEIHPINEVIPSGTAATTPEIPKIVECDVMEKNKRRIVLNDCVLVIAMMMLYVVMSRQARSIDGFDMPSLLCLELKMPSLTGSAVVSVMKLFGKKKKEFPKEEQQSSETSGVKSMIGSKMEELESMEVPSGALVGLSVTVPLSEESQNSAERIANNFDESKPATIQFETPRKPPLRIQKLVPYFADR